MSVIKMTDLDLAGKRVLIRADLNVPVKRRQGHFRCTYRCDSADHQAGSGKGRQADDHLPPGSSDRGGEYNEEFSWLRFVNYLKDALSCPVRLAKDYLDGVDVAAGELVVLENCRFNKGEKKNTEELAKNTPPCVTSL